SDRQATQPAAHREGDYGRNGRDPRRLRARRPSTCRRRSDHSVLMLAARMTFAHFSVWLAINLPKSVGVPDSGGLPRATSRALILGFESPALIALLSLSMTSPGVFLGAPKPCQPIAS